MSEQAVEPSIDLTSNAGNEGVLTDTPPTFAKIAGVIWPGFTEDKSIYGGETSRQTIDVLFSAIAQRQYQGSLPVTAEAGQPQDIEEDDPISPGTEAPISPGTDAPLTLEEPVLDQPSYAIITLRALRETFNASYSTGNLNENFVKKYDTVGWDDPSSTNYTNALGKLSQHEKDLKELFQPPVTEATLPSGAPALAHHDSFGSPGGDEIFGYLSSRTSQQNLFASQTSSMLGSSMPSRRPTGLMIRSDPELAQSLPIEKVDERLKEIATESDGSEGV